MGLFEEAVDHALSVDLTLAMRNAEAAEDDEDLRKKLWLRIAKHVVMEEKNIDKAMQVRLRFHPHPGLCRVVHLCGHLVRPNRLQNV